MELIKFTQYSLSIEALKQAINYQQSLIDAINHTILALDSPDQVPAQIIELVANAIVLTERAKEELETILLLNECQIIIGNYNLVPKDEAIPADFDWRDYLE